MILTITLQPHWLVYISINILLCFYLDLFHEICIILFHTIVYYLPCFL